MSTDRDAEIDRWREVPGLVVALHSEHAAAAAAARSRYARSPARVFWDPATGKTAVARPPSPAYWLIKQAESDFLRGPVDAFAGLQRPLGGPHPLAAAIVGGALGSGLGYAGGALAERLLPEGRFERGRLRRTLALTGGLAGAAPGAAWAGANLANADVAGGGSAARAVVSPWPFAKESGVDPRFVKAADAGSAFYLPTIPVDAFNRAIWSDALQPANPYGTKGAFGTDEQPLQTPPWAAAAASGIVAGTGAAAGAAVVSPWQLAQTAAASAGAGLLAATAFGKTLGALAGLRPDAQRQLQGLGLWGGLVAGAVHGLFGGGRAG